MRDYTAYDSLLQHSLSQELRKQSFGAPQLKKARENIIASTYARFGVQLLLHPRAYLSPLEGNWEIIKACAYGGFCRIFRFFPYHIFTSMTGLYIIDPLGRTVNGTFQDM